MKILYKIAIILLLAVFFISCEKKTEYGSFSISMKDSPSVYREVNVDIESIEIYVEQQGGGHWYSLVTNKGVYNLLLLQNMPVLLANHTSVPIGKISSIRINLGPDNSVNINGVMYPLRSLSGTEQRQKINIPVEYTITASGKLNTLIDFDAEKSVIKNAKNEFFLNPVIVAGITGSPMDSY
ncbi:MAG TPA: DUF4382 domain-containing protein [Bacteroidia bacterium]|jgi:hypothetical protein|nr:DUF4382 domain-containing protein [Bacteroidia bacterium]